MTIAKQLKIKDFPFEIKDSNGKEIYWENSYGVTEDNRPKTDVQLAHCSCGQVWKARITWEAESSK